MSELKLMSKEDQITSLLNTLARDVESLVESWEGETGLRLKSIKIRHFHDANNRYSVRAACKVEVSSKGAGPEAEMHHILSDEDAAELESLLEGGTIGRRQMIKRLLRLRDLKMAEEVWR